MKTNFDKTCDPNFSLLSSSNFSSTNWKWLKFLKFDFGMLCYLGSLLNKLQTRSHLVLRYRFSLSLSHKFLWENMDPTCICAILFGCCWDWLIDWFLGSNYEQETKKANPSSASNSSGFGDCIYVDEEHKSPKEDIPVPMFLEQTEVMPSETHEMVSTFLNSFLFFWKLSWPICKVVIEMLNC